MRAAELCSTQHTCCVWGAGEHPDTRRTVTRKLLWLSVLCLCRCGWGHHHQHPDKSQQWTEAGHCLCLSEKNQKGSKIWRNSNYWIFFLWTIGFFRVYLFTETEYASALSMLSQFRTGTTLKCVEYAQLGLKAVGDGGFLAPSEIMVGSTGFPGEMC